MARIRSALVWGIAVSSMLADPAEATPVDTLGFGAREKAMGRADAAGKPDFAANYYSPANLAFAERTILGFGFTQTNFSLDSTGEPSNIAPATGWAFGVVAPGKLANIPIALGVAGHLPRGHISSSQTIREPDPYWVMYEGRVQLLYTSLNLAVRLLPTWSIAVGTASLATTDGALSVRGTAVLPEFERSEYESELEHQVNARLASVRYAQYSTALELSEELKVQLSYREEARLEAKLGAGLDADVDGTLVQIPVQYDVLVESVRMFVPRQLSASASLNRSPLTLAVDLTFSQWSQYESPISRTSTEVEAQPPPGVTIDLPEGPAPPLLASPRFRDQWAPSVGFEYRLEPGARVKLPLRCGYGFSKSPVPPQTGATSFLDADRHLLSAGVGSVFGGLEPVLAGELRLDLAVQWGVLRERPARGPAALGHRTPRHDGSFLALSGDMTVEF